MKCPVCKTPDLLITERQSIEIDYCPSCRGVWLDRGELDKLAAQMNDAPPARTHYDNERRYDERHRGDYRHDNTRHDSHRNEHGGYRKKRSLFDIFDFD
jgi:uncharacterized protein